MKFRRKNDSAPLSDEVETTDEELAPAPGPYDVDDLPDDGIKRVDLGSLLIEPEGGRELRVEVSESTGDVNSVMLAGQDGAVELRAFAAPRNGDLWSQVRPQIAADMAQRGGTATEREGPVRNRAPTARSR